MKSHVSTSHNHDLRHDFQVLVEDAQTLLTATADVAGEKVADARKRLSAAVERGRETWNHVQDQAIEGAKAADKVIRSNPYRSIGVALGVGAVVGYIVASRRSK